MNEIYLKLNQNSAIDAFLVLALNIMQALSGVSTINFEQVNIGW